VGREAEGAPRAAEVDMTGILSPRETMSPGWHPMQFAKDWIKAEPRLRGKTGASRRCSLIALMDAIDRREGRVWKTQEEIAREWSIAPRTFRAHLKEFEVYGIIQRERRHRKQGPLAGKRAADHIYFYDSENTIDKFLEGFDAH
jgi:hypothetical protein